MSAVTHNNNGNISISGVAIRLKDRMRTLRSVSFKVNKEDRQVEWKYNKEERTLEATFEPPLEVSASDQLDFRIHRSFSIGSSSWSGKEEEIPPIEASQLLDAGPNKQGEIQEWSRSFDGTNISVQLSQRASNQGSANQDAPVLHSGQYEGLLSEQGGELVPTTDEITSACPQFRILLVGNAGVGKSSLINQAFGVTDAKVSHLEAGQADINVEITSDENPRFILHDTQGFEPGRIENFQKVRQFIETRDKMPELKDKLHAVWICIATPFVGGRTLETGVENLLESKKRGLLGQVPIIVVWTKYDLLVNHEYFGLRKSLSKELAPEGIRPLARDKASRFVKDNCVAPLEARFGAELLCAAVSTRKEYRGTLTDLIKLTCKHVKEHVAEEASSTAVMAQKMDCALKIDLSIAVGRSRYWSGLIASANFPGFKLEQCLGVIHRDIVAVWNFQDPDMNLLSTEFKKQILSMVNKVSDGELRNPNTGLGAGLSMVGTVAGVTAVFSGPAAPIVVPIAAGIVVINWLYDVYQNTPVTLQRIMAYIVDLTLVMQTLFSLVQGDHPITSHGIIEQACTAYYDSELMRKAHSMILEHVEETKIFHAGTQDTTIEKLIEIIGLFHADSMEIPNA